MKLKPSQASSTLSPSRDGAGGSMALANVIAKARCKARLTQDKVARHMRTTQSNVARLDVRRPTPSIRTLNKFVLAVGAWLTIVLNRLTTKNVPEVRERRSDYNRIPTC